MKKWYDLLKMMKKYNQAEDWARIDQDIHWWQSIQWLAEDEVNEW